MNRENEFSIFLRESIANLNIDYERIESLLIAKKNKFLKNAYNDILKLLNVYSVKTSFFKKAVYIPYILDSDKSKVYLQVEKILKRKGFHIINYNKGDALSVINKKIFNIEKLLKKFKAGDKLIFDYNIDKKFSKKLREYYLIIEPYEYQYKIDNIGCINIYEHAGDLYANSDIQELSLKCSLVRGKNLNSKNSVCNTLIKPMVNINDNDDIYYQPDDIVYGMPPKGFISNIRSFFSIIQSNKKITKFKLIDKYYCKTDKADSYNDEKTVLKYSKYLLKAGYRDINDIKNLCLVLNIKNYEINDDLSIDVTGNVNISNKQLKIIPLKFNKISGDFDCSGNFLKNLKNCPIKVGGNFYCFNNSIDKLLEAPSYVGNNYDCSNNNIGSLVGSPNIIRGFFNASNNGLNSLIGSPKIIRNYFDVSKNYITSLEDGPKGVGGYYDISDQLNGVRYNEYDISNNTKVLDKIFV